jgi:hypothetical protein
MGSIVAEILSVGIVRLCNISTIKDYSMRFGEATINFPDPAVPVPEKYPFSVEETKYRRIRQDTIVSVVLSDRVPVPDTAPLPDDSRVIRLEYK